MNKEYNKYAKVKTFINASDRTINDFLEGLHFIDMQIAICEHKTIVMIMYFEEIKRNG